MSYCRRVFLCSEVTDCAKLMKVNLTAQKVLDHRVSSLKINELGGKEQRGRAEFARKTETLENELQAAKKLLRGIFGYDTSHSTKS